MWLILTTNSTHEGSKNSKGTEIRVNHEGSWFGEGATIYAKEVKENIFLLFVILKDIHIENIQALIAHFDCFSSIGTKEPEQIMFYLSIKDKEDLHYFENYLKISNN